MTRRRLRWKVQPWDTFGGSRLHVSRYTTIQNIPLICWFLLLRVIYLAHSYPEGNPICNVLFRQRFSYIIQLTMVPIEGWLMTKIKLALILYYPWYLKYYKLANELGLDMADGPAEYRGFTHDLEWISYGRKSLLVLDIISILTSIVTRNLFSS